HWPYTHILVRGNSHFAPPEVMEVIAHRRRIDFVFGLAGNAVLLRQGAPVMQEARALFRQQPAVAHAYGEPRPARSRLYEEFSYAAASGNQPWRGVTKGKARGGGGN